MARKKSARRKPKTTQAKQPAATGGRRAPIAGLVVAGLVFVAICVHYWSEIGSFVLDDAFIFFRYADNIVQGHGPVYNPGEHVEGYTSFLWLLLIAGGMAFGASPVAVVQLLGVLCGLGTLWFTWQIARRCFPEHRWAPVVTVLLLAVNRTFAVWAIAGLETKLFTMLAVAAYYSWLAGGLALRTRFRVPLTGVLVGLLPLARPEGYLIVALVGVVELGRTLRSRSWRPLLLNAAAVIAIAGGHLLFRLVYYGDYVPNTFHAKVGGLQLDAGLTYLWALIEENGLHLTGLVVLAGAFGLARRPDDRGPILAFLALAPFVLVYVTVICGDYFEFRFLDLALPSLALATTAGVHWLFVRFSAAPARFAALALALAALALNAWTVVEPREGDKNISSPEREAGYTERFLKAGRWLANNIGPDESLAIRPAGAIAYVTRARCLDLLGLNDREIAADAANVDESRTIGHQRKITPRYSMNRGYTYHIGHPRLRAKPWKPGSWASIEIEPDTYLRMMVLTDDARFENRVYRLDEHAGLLEGIHPGRAVSRDSSSEAR